MKLNESILENLKKEDKSFNISNKENLNEAVKDNIDIVKILPEIIDAFQHLSNSFIFKEIKFYCEFDEYIDSYEEDVYDERLSEIEEENWLVIDVDRGNGSYDTVTIGRK